MVQKIKQSLGTAILAFALATLSQGVFAWGGSSYGDSSGSTSSTSTTSGGSSYSGSSYSGSSSGSSWGSDGSDSGWTAADCRSCHDDWKNLPLKFANVDNHHKLVGTRVRHSTAPNASLSDHYLCMSCHAADLSSGYVEYVAERDCLVCHKVTTVATQYRGNRHHDTQTAQNRRCSTCHSRMPGGRSWR